MIFPRQVKALLQKSLELRDQRDAKQITLRGTAKCRQRPTNLQARLTELVRAGENQCGQRAIRRRISSGTTVSWFTFLRHKGIDATNSSGRAGDSSGGGEPEGVGRQPDGSRRSDDVDSDDGIVHGQKDRGVMRWEFVSRVSACVARIMGQCCCRTRDRTLNNYDFLFFIAASIRPVTSTCAAADRSAASRE